MEMIEPVRRRLPMVVSGFTAPGVSSVIVDNRRGSREATRHLLELGHRRFVVASVLWQFRPPVFHPGQGSPRSFVAAGPPMVERMAGVAEALAAFGLSLDDMPIVEACGTPEEEAAFGNGAGMVLDLAPEATAVIGLTDGIALSILEQAHKRGIAVPRDLSIVGFDDNESSARSDPPADHGAQFGLRERPAIGPIAAGRRAPANHRPAGGTGGPCLDGAAPPAAGQGQIARRQGGRCRGLGAKRSQPERHHTSRANAPVGSALRPLEVDVGLLDPAERRAMGGRVTPGHDDRGVESQSGAAVVLAEPSRHLTAMSGGD